MSKVGVILKKSEIADHVFNKIGDIVKTSDFIAAGLRSEDVVKLCRDGDIKRIKHGLYQSARNSNIPEENLIASLIPQGIVCIESALFHYGYSDFTPREWSIAIPRGQTRAIKRLQQISVKPYYVSADLMDLGKTTDDFTGVRLPVYDRERTICDCFKYRTKLDNEMFNKAVNAYVADHKKNLVNLVTYSKKMRLYKKVMNVMEVLLNG